MNIKSLLLGSAAALVAVSGARAADAVTLAPEPEAVEYVRVCDAYGAGFFYIPGTETCLKIGGYIRYDIGGGDLFGVNVDEDGDVDTYYKRARAALQVDARTDTELGTLRGYMHLNFDYDRGSASSDVAKIEHAYIELGGFRIGKTDSLFSTFTGYAGNVINDDLVGYGPFGTHQIAYTFTGGSGFSAAIALEEGSDGYALDSYVPHVVAGVGFTQGWGGVSVVGGYDANNEEWAAKARVDVKASEMISLFVMAGYASDPSYYGSWAGADGNWAVWAGASAKVSPKATVNFQGSYADNYETWALVGNVAYELVPGFTITPEVAYRDSAVTDGHFGGFLRFQRSF